MSPREEVLTEADQQRVVTPVVTDDDDVVEEVSVRPRRLSEFVGQAEVKEHLEIVLEAARRRGQPADHVLLCGPPGLGKTTLAGIVAAEMGVSLRVTSGPALLKGGDLVAILSDLAEGDVLFFDEIHRLSRVAEEILYPAMEDFRVDVMLGKGPMARSIPLELPAFTLVGATNRFGFVGRLDYYDPGELEAIVKRSARILAVPIEPEAASELARRSRGTPRIANRLLRRVRDFAEVRRQGVVDREAADAGLTTFGVDELGLDKVDRSILAAICRRFGGGPVGIKTVAVSVGEEPETVEDVYEPFLLQVGMLKRTARGRVATPAAWSHLGLNSPEQAPAGLFDSR